MFPVVSVSTVYSIETAHLACTLLMVPTPLPSPASSDSSLEDSRPKLKATTLIHLRSPLSTSIPRYPRKTARWPRYVYTSSHSEYPPFRSHPANTVCPHLRRYRIFKATYPNVTRTKYFPHRTRLSKDEIPKLYPEETLAICVALAESSGHEAGSDPFSLPPSLPSATHSGTNIPTSHYSLKGLVATEDGSLPDPSSRNARISTFSTSGDSAVSLFSKYPNFDSQCSGLIDYVYDPDADEPLDDDEEVDWLHNPETLIAEKLVKQCNRPPPLHPAYLKAPTESSLSRRGLLNITALILLISTILAVFIAYPIVTIISDEERNKMITSNTRINSTGQAVDSDTDFLLGGGSTTTTSSLATTTESTTSTAHIPLPTMTSATSTSTTSSRTRPSTSTTMTPSTTLDPDASTITPTDSAVLRKREEYAKKKPWARRSSRDFGQPTVSSTTTMPPEM